MVMELRGFIGGGRCMKQDGYVVTVFRDSLDGPLVCKVKKVERRALRPR